MCIRDSGNIVFDEDGNTIETPMVDRYFNYLGNLLQGDLGTSYQKGLSLIHISLRRGHQGRQDRVLERPHGRLRVR